MTLVFNIAKYDTVQFIFTENFYYGVYMGLLLPIALDTRTNKKIHISERILPGAVLVCPFCMHSVHVKGGDDKLRQKHFAHKKSSNCSTNRETLLHEGAKIYLNNALTQGLNIDLKAKVSMLEDDKIKSLLTSLNIDSISFSTSSVYPYPKAIHSTEERFKKVQPDVLSYVEDFDKTCMFAWEIFVTHEVDEDKSELFREYGIPFLELSPVTNKNDGYIYWIKSYGGFDLFNKDHYLSDFIKQAFQKELDAALAAERLKLSGEHADQLSKVEASFKDNLMNAETSYREKFNEFLQAAKIEWKKEQSIKSNYHNNIQATVENCRIESNLQSIVNGLSIWQDINTPDAFSSLIVTVINDFYSRQGLIKDSGTWYFVEGARNGTNSKGNYCAQLICDKIAYDFHSTENLLVGIYRNLLSLNIIRGILSDDIKPRNRRLIGVKLFLPDATWSKNVAHVILAPGYNLDNTCEVTITSIHCEHINNDLLIMINDNIPVSKHTFQLLNTINILCSHYKLAANVVRNTRDDLLVVDMKINGLIDRKRLKNYLTDNILQLNETNE